LGVTLGIWASLFTQSEKFHFFLSLLLSPPDKYRTCFQRAVDPGNDLTEDTILRDKYVPYTPPFATEDEELTNGTVYLSLVADTLVNLTCDDQLILEEIVLQWVGVSYLWFSMNFVAAYSPTYILNFLINQFRTMLGKTLVLCACLMMAMRFTRKSMFTMMAQWMSLKQQHSKWTLCLFPILDGSMSLLTMTRSMASPVLF
jgi:hypothetical protein